MYIEMLLQIVRPLSTISFEFKKVSHVFAYRYNPIRLQPHFRLPSDRVIELTSHNNVIAAIKTSESLLQGLEKVLVISRARQSVERVNHIDGGIRGEPAGRCVVDRDR